MKKRLKNPFYKIRKAFTLIEVIIYIALSSVVIVSIMTFSIHMIYTGEKTIIRHEAEQNAYFVLQRIIDEIRSAKDLNINSSDFGNNPGVLSLSKKDAEKNPTVFNVSDSIIRIQQGSKSPLPLLPDNIQITNLVFTNLSIANKTKTIRIQLTLRHKNADSSNMADVTVSVEGSAVIRSQSS